VFFIKKVDWVIFYKTIKLMNETNPYLTKDKRGMVSVRREIIDEIL
jgi:hypothetical protein